MENNLFNGFELTEELSEVVTNKIAQEQYTDVIKDAFLFLSEYIREISGEDGDGVALIGKAFGGKAPLIKLSSLQSEAEKSVQEGMQFVLRGLYQSFRNPRNHNSHSDDRDTCLRVITMIDTMYKYIKENNQSYSTDDIIKSVFDPFFVGSDKYAESLVSNIPTSNRFDAFITVVNKIDEGDLEKLNFFIRALYRVFSSELIDSAAKFIADKMKGKDPKETSQYLSIMRNDMWKYLPQDVKIRAENMILIELRKGYINSIYIEGTFGKWAAKFGEHFEMKEQLKEAIIDRLWDSWYSQDYISRFYLREFPRLFNEKRDIEEIVRGIIYATMSNKARAFRRRFLDVVGEFPEQWKGVIKESVELRMSEDESYGEDIIRILKQN